MSNISVHIGTCDILRVLDSIPVISVYNGFRYFESKQQIKLKLSANNKTSYGNLGESLKKK
jgi:hypothetical protein